jgi:hypothetical protein
MPPIFLGNSPPLRLNLGQCGKMLKLFEVALSEAGAFETF